MTLTGELVAGEVGKQIIWNPNPTPLPASPINLTGMTVTLKVLFPDGVTEKTFAMVVAGGGLTATYTTAANDFPAGGRYTFQFIAVGVSLTLKSQLVLVFVADQL